MKSEELLRMNLQYFAEPNNDEGGEGDDPKDPKDLEGGEKDTNNLFTQEEMQQKINDAVEARLARQEKDFKEKLKKEREKAKSDAEKYAKMTESEKEDAELQERIKKLEERERELNNRELLTNIQSDLQERKLPVSFAESLLMLQDNEKIKKSIEEIAKVWNDEITEAKKANVRQSTPKDSVTSYGGKESHKSKADFFNEGRKI